MTEKEAKALLDAMQAPEPQHIYENAEKESKKEIRKPQKEKEDE